MRTTFVHRLSLGLVALAAAAGAWGAAPLTTRADELQLAQNNLAALQERYGDQNPRLAVDSDRRNAPEIGRAHV